MSKQTHIFATRSDLEPGLKEFESKNKVKYARCDLYHGPIYEQYLSLLDWTDLGRNTTGDHVSGPRFLIVPRDCKINVEPVPQVTGTPSKKDSVEGYDDLYRLTSETVASDPRGNNGQVTYTLDNVGNRLQRSSTLPAIVPTGLLSYDANDRVSTDSYDANGNTTFNSGQTNVYDFENRLVQRGRCDCGL